MHDDEGHVKNKFDAVMKELDVAVAILKEACGEEQAQFIEESIYHVLVDLVTTIAPDLQPPEGSRLN